MAKPIQIILLLVSSLLISPAVSCDTPTSISSWCNQTPHPKICEYIISTHPKYQIPIKTKSNFFELSSHLALDHAIESHNRMYSLGYTCASPKEKTAWTDCIELYGDTIRHINKTLDRKVKRTAADVQTWLSTALTNIETCRAGFIDFGITDNVYGMIKNNVSMLISNMLALNVGDYYGEKSKHKNKEGFPSWVSHNVRKLLQSSNTPANIVVAQDGSGNYKTVSEAIEAAGKRSGKGRFVIHVKQGVYNEYVNIGNSLINIMLTGDGIGKTVITGSRSVGGGSTTYRSATFAVTGDGFIAKGITFRNTAGAANHQAVAVRSGSDRSVFYQCSIEGYQDTLYVYSDRQFFTQCNIYGTVDFIFGNAAVVFQNCNLFARLPPQKTNTITAQGRTDPNQNTGISIQNCVVTAASDLKPVQTTVNTYLGRPWKEYSRTVYLETYLDSLINQAGWYPWDGNFALNTLYYGEYVNTGPGSSTRNRVNWKGYHVITSSSVASQFTPENFFAGNSWLPQVHVPYKDGL